MTIVGLQYPLGTLVGTNPLPAPIQYDFPPLPSYARIPTAAQAGVAVNPMFSASSYPSPPPTSGNFSGTFSRVSRLGSPVWGTTQAFYPPTNASANARCQRPQGCFGSRAIIRCAYKSARALNALCAGCQ